MNEDEILTAQSTALSPALRAQEEDDDVAAFTSYASLAAVIRYARDLIENDYVAEAFGELDRVVHYLDEPRGLSAAEAPTSAEEEKESRNG